MIQKLAQYPPNTKLVMAHDWSEPLLNDEYLLIEDAATIALTSTGHAIRPDELQRLRDRELATVEA